MPYYKLAFNKPLAALYTYEHELVLPSLIRVNAPLGPRTYPAVLIGPSETADVQDLTNRGVAIKRIRHVIDEVPLLTGEQYKLAQWMSEYYLASLGECLFTMLPSARREKHHKISQTAISHFTEKDILLNLEQQHCVNAIVGEKVDHEAPRILYLYGPTGSGKTEVFLQASHRVVQGGKQVLYLVPEISLVYQSYPVLCKRFDPSLIAVLHSALTPSHRLREWRRILNGQARVIVGVRSAVFAPAQELALIIIDEEHDGAYKSDTTPRYHVRQIAMKRSLLTRARLVMGSATPSLESWNYMQTRHCTALRLSRRASGGNQADMELVSLQHVSGILSPTLQAHMNDTLEAGFQVLLLINRRGFSRLFLCVQCGHTISCSQCSVPLVLHKKGAVNILCCHHCGYSATAPSICPECGYTSLSIRGWGTQRVHTEVQRLFPHYNVARFDSDVAASREEAQRVVASFYKGESSIVVGTQIMAKGINIPRLQLVGVLCVDNVFSLPDFRASERAMSLLTQVSGRAGRFFVGGKVIIQTYMKEHPLLQIMLDGTQTMFYERELERRKTFALPPFARIVRLVFRGKEQDKVMACAETFAQQFEVYRRTQHQYRSCSVLGPAECAFAKLAGNYRCHIVLSAGKQSLLIALVRALLVHEDLQNRVRAKRVYIEIDPDAQTMM